MFASRQQSQNRLIFEASAGNRFKFQRVTQTIHKRTIDARMQYDVQSFVQFSSPLLNSNSFQGTANYGVLFW